MLDFSVITTALKQQLSTKLTENGSASRYLIKRSEHTNQRPDKTPWIGIYRGTTSYEPRSIGNSLCNWRAIAQIKVIVQGASRSNGAEAEERSETYTKEVLDAILTDYSIGGTVETIVGFEVEPVYNRDVNASLHFHMNIITVSVQTKTGRGS